LLYISFRKIADLNKELFTIKLSRKESDYLYYKTISISKSINSDGLEVLVLKSACDNDKAGIDFVKVFISKEDVWSEIKNDSKKKLNEQVKSLE